MSLEDLRALARAHNERDAAAGIIPRYIEDEATLAMVARLVAPALKRPKVGARDAA